MRTKVAAFVDNRDVHGLLDFRSLLFSSCNYLACFPQGHHQSPFRGKALQTVIHKRILGLILAKEQRRVLDTACAWRYFDKCLHHVVVSAPGNRFMERPVRELGVKQHRR